MVPLAGFIKMVLVKEGVEFTVIAPGGFRILGAIEAVARTHNLNVTITSACDGEHSGPEDPHHKGLAYDIRAHDLPDPAIFLQELQSELGTEQFFSFIEDPDTPNEHIHVQVRKGHTYME